MKAFLSGKLGLLVAALVITTIVSMILIFVPNIQDGIRLGIQVTARISLFLFSLAFVASFLKNKYLMKNRRYLGLAFAFSHLLHGILFLTLYKVDPVLFFQVAKPTTIIGGGLGYVFIFAMALTSNDYSVRKLGMKKWRTLHSIGMYYLWFVFFVSYAGRVFRDPWYLVLVLPMVAMLAGKVVGKTRAKVSL